MFNAVGQSDLVSGFFWDDQWPGAEGHWGDAVPNVTEDCGLTKDDLIQGTNAWATNMEALKKYTLSKGKFAWQMLWTGGDADRRGTTCPGPQVNQKDCAAALRSMCTADSPAQKRTMMYAFAPGHCSQHEKVIDPPFLKEDLANFLLVRGPYAYLGHGWLGCSHEYVFPEELNVDYGEPTELCKETAPQSGIFTRDWTKATIQMDCNTYTPSITMK